MRDVLRIGLIWIASALCMVGGVAAQSAAVTGVIEDAETGEALAGANVVVFEEDASDALGGAAAGADGRYSVSGLSGGAYRLRVQFVGYETTEEPFSVADGETRTVDVAMAPSNFDLNPVVVTASRRQEKAVDAPASVSVLGPKDLETDAAPSAAASLRNTPGVDIAKGGLDRYQISLRGFNSAFVANTFALSDFRQIAAPSLGINTFASAPISPLDIAQIEVVRGPGSALYGPGVGQGVIHFISKDPFEYPGTSALVAGGQQSLFQGSLRHAGVVNEKLGYKVVGYYSQGEDWRLDPSTQDSTVLNAIAEQRFDKDGDVIGPIDGRDYDTWKGYGSGQLSYQISPAATLTATGGYGSIKQVNIANTGENQTDNFALYYGQLRLQAGGLFVQGYVNALDSGDTFFYRSGNPVIDQSTQLVGQVQYGLDVWDGRESLTFGVDAERTTPRTSGTVHGRNEGRDQINEIGAYVQSETSLIPERLSLTLAARLDRDDIIEKTQLSPRAALVYKPVPNQSVRATYNRAFATPAGVNFFLDLLIAPAGAGGSPFSVRGRGAVDGWTFADNLQTSSFVPGVGRYEGVGLPLNVGYGAALAGLNEAGAFDALPPEARGQLLQLLQSRAGAIEGFSQGALGFPEGDGLRIVQGVEDFAPIEQSVTNTFELGYKGLIADRLLLTVDGYYERKTNFLSELRQITPLVVVPNVASDLSAAVAAAFTDEELAQFGLDVETLAGIFEQGGAGLAANPIGLVETEENFDAGTPPELMLTYVNFGEISFFGTDLAAQFQATDQLDLFANYSVVSDNFFDSEEVGEEGTGLETSMNAPQHKVRGGFDYRRDGGFSFNAAGRYVSEFRVRSGVHDGTVPAYFVLDLGAGYDFADYVPGNLRLDLTAQNVLGNEHREYVDTPAIGRLITTRLTYRLP